MADISGGGQMTGGLGSEYCFSPRIMTLSSKERVSGGGLLAKKPRDTKSQWGV